MSFVLSDTRGGVTHLTLNRPERLNAIGPALLADLHRAVQAAMADPAAAVIVLRAAGRAFCAGDDLRDLVGVPKTAAESRDFIARLQDVSRLLALGPKPVICAVQGWAVGGGAAWPLNADFTLWAEDAVLYCPEAKYGLFVSGGTSLLLPERVGPEAAARIMVLGEQVAGRRLLDLGIAGDLVPAAELEPAAAALAARLLTMPAPSLARYKAARTDALRQPLEAALAREADYMRQAVLDLAQNLDRLPDLAHRAEDADEAGR